MRNQLFVISAVMIFSIGIFAIVTLADSINGIEKNNIDINFGNLTDQFPNLIRSSLYNKLQTGTFLYNGNSYNFHDDIYIGNIFFSHDYATSRINGTETMVVQTNQLLYDYVFDSSFWCNITSSSSCRFSNPEYAHPINISMLGRQFSIVGIDVNAVTMISGSGVIQYQATCYTGGTGSSNYNFPGEADWCIQGWFAVPGKITAGDKIQVVYKPLSTQYLNATLGTTKLSLPNSFGEIGFEGFNTNSFVTLTVRDIEGVSTYHLVGGATTNASVAVQNLNGIEIDADVPISLVDPITNTGYSKAFILFNNSINATAFPVMIGFWDSTNNRIGVNVTGCAAPATGTTDSYCAFLNNNNWASFSIIVSYGGGATSKDQQVIFVNVSKNGACQAVGGTNCNSYIRTFQIANRISDFPPYSASPAGVLINSVNKSLWSTSSAPSFRLYTSDSAEPKDVQSPQTPSGGGPAAYQDIGTAAQDVVSNNGVIVVSPYANSALNQVMIKVPAQSLAVKAYVGNMSSTSDLEQRISSLESRVSTLESLFNSLNSAVNDIVSMLANILSQLTTIENNLNITNITTSTTTTSSTTTTTTTSSTTTTTSSTTTTTPTTAVLLDSQGCQFGQISCPSVGYKSCTYKFTKSGNVYPAQITCDTTNTKSNPGSLSPGQSLCPDYDSGKGYTTTIRCQVFGNP
jgi:uncharacterized coiled-coil protein SlyX